MGIFLVVAGHAFGAACHLTTGTTQQIMMGVYKYIYAFHMPFFFFIAGVTFRSHEPFAAFCKKKAFRLLIPYFVFGLLSLGLFCLLADIGYQHLTAESTTTFYTDKKPLSPPLLLLNLLIGGYFQHGFVYNSVLWFIPVLFAAQMILYPVDRCRQRRWLVFVAVAAFPVGWWIRCRLGTPLPLGLGLAFYYLPYLAAGRLLGNHPVLPVGLSPFRQQTIAIGMLVIGGILAYFNPMQYQSAITYEAVNMAVAFLCIFAWTSLCQVFTLKLPYATLIGSSTLGIMLLHKYPLLFFQNFFLPTRFFFRQSAGIVVPACLIVSLLALFLSLLACQLIRRICPWTLGEDATRK